MNVYYNEFDPKAAAWLRELISMGMIAPGYVDERSILDVKPEDLEGYKQHHFFAGIGVWSYALRNAGWSDETPVCTASLPCQPFSTAGNQKGKDDERHLLPHFMQLVKECGFNTIFGEQVEGAIRHGWLDDLQTVMEGEGYAIGHCVLGAHSVNAAHIRQRLYWVADKRVANTNGIRQQRQGEVGQPVNTEKNRDREKYRVVNACNINSGMAYPKREGLEGRMLAGEQYGEQRREGQAKYYSESCVDDEWGNAEWWYCRDYTQRPVKSGIKPLVDGLARGVVYSGGEIDPNNTAFARTIRLKGYGNAINADVAELFVSSFMEVTNAE